MEECKSKVWPVRNILSFPNLAPAIEQSNDFALDIQSLFKGEKAGHMERWEYGPSLFKNDPAGGSFYWANLVKDPGNYYLTNSDISCIQHAITTDKLQKYLMQINTVVELGPGSEKAIISKTIPFLKKCKNLKKYIAVDATLDQAKESSVLVGNHMTVSVGVRECNFMHTPISPIESGQSALVMWGSSLGNIEGSANSNPQRKLIGTLHTIQNSMKSGDILIICFDTEENEDKIIKAYSEPNLQAQVLSVVHKAKRDLYVSGKFDPRLWRHKPVWYPKSQQLAHTLYPLFDQELCIDRQIIKIPAWTEFISNNSYKFRSDTIVAAAKNSGFSAETIQFGPMAILIATKV